MTTTPAQGAVLARSPAQVVLRFDEAVFTVTDSVRVFDGRAQRVDTGEVSRLGPEAVAVRLPAELPDDTYTVAWRVLSADSHPVRGAFVFSVGRPVGDGSGVADRVLDEGGSASARWALTLTRLAGLALILLCVGGVAVLAFAADAADPRMRPLWRAVAVAAALLAVDSLAWISLTGVRAAALGLDAAIRWPLVREVLETSFGRVWLARAALGLTLAGLAVLVAQTRSEWLLSAAVLAAAAIAVTPALSGHASVEGPLAILADSAHVLAAGIWAGGLASVALLLVTAGGDRWSLAAKVVPRFSALAVASVIVLVASGALSGFLEIRAWSALWETTYGRLVLAKVALLVPLLAFGAYNNRISLPRLRHGRPGSGVRRRFVWTIALELVFLSAVVGVTAALVAEPPARAQAARGVVTREGTIGPYQASLVVDPARTGPNEIHVYLLDSTGGLAAIDEIAVSAALAAADVGPLRFEAVPAGPGHVIVTDAQLPLAGDWRFRLDVRSGEFDQWSTTFVIPIRKDS